MTYIHDYRPQLERSTSTSIGLSTYRRDDYDDDFVSSQFNVKIATLTCIYECSLCNLLYCACILIFFYRRRVYLYFRFMFSVLGDMFWTCDIWIGCLHFFKICRDFFRIFWAFYLAFCAYRLRPIRVDETDPSQWPPSRRPRSRLWTIVISAWIKDKLHKSSPLTYA